MNKTELIAAVMNELPNMEALVKDIPLSKIRGYCEVPTPAKSADWWSSSWDLKGRLEAWVPDNDKLSYTFRYSEGWGNIILSIKGEWV